MQLNAYNKRKRSEEQRELVRKAARTAIIDGKKVLIVPKGFSVLTKPWSSF